MDIFNHKKVEDLERKLEGIEYENRRLHRELYRSTKDFQAILKLKNSTPTDCVPGEYCKVCEFGKHVFNRYYASSYTIYRNSYDATVSGYVCNRGNICQNFIQKTEEKK